MSSSFSEKSGSHPQHAGMPQPLPPSQAHFDNIALDFLPKYEAQFNDNLRNFGDPEAQYGDQKGLGIHLREPKRDNQRRKAKRNLIIIVVVSLAAIVAVVVGLFASEKGHEVPSSSPTPAAQTTVTISNGAETAAQRSLIHRSTSGIPDGVVVVTATVTVQAAPTTTQYFSGQLSEVTDSITTTEVTTQQATSIPQTVTVTGPAQKVTFSPTSFSFSPTTTSTTSSSSITSSTIDAAAESSIQAALSSLSLALIAKPIPTSSTFVTSIKPAPSPTTTLPSPASTPVSSAAKSTSSSDVVGGLFNFCSVPGSSCNEKRSDEKEGEMEFGGELEIDGHEIGGTVELGGEAETDGHGAGISVQFNGTGYEGNRAASAAASATGVANVSFA